MNLMEVQHILSQSTKNILMRMVQALIRGHSQDAGFAEVADVESISDGSESFQWVYRKLHDAVIAEINRDREVLAKAYFAIMSATSKESADHFVASFISHEVPHTIAELQEKQPMSLKTDEIWI